MHPEFILTAQWLPCANLISVFLQTLSLFGLLYTRRLKKVDRFNLTKRNEKKVCLTSNMINYSVEFTRYDEEK